MRIQTSSRARGLAIACAVAIAGVGVVGAAPAQAENDFANGFEDQLGRIAAHQVVNLGAFILSGGYYHPQAQVRHAPYGYRHADPYAYGYRHPTPRKHYRKHKHHRRHHRKHARRAYEPRRPVYRHHDHTHDDYRALQDCDDYPQTTRRHRYEDDGWGYEYDD